MTGSFTQADLEMFARFGIPPDLLDKAGVRRVTDAEARRYGITGSGDLGGIFIPYFDPVTGRRVTARLRRDHPEVGANRKPQNKYISPYGDNSHLYFPPGAGVLLPDITVPIVIVEAEKSALALTALAAANGRRLLVVATGGCWGWRGKAGIEPGPDGEREEVRGPLADLDRIAWPGRQAIMLLDSNVATNPHVQAAEQALGEELGRRRAIGFRARLPEEPGVNGPDDYIAVHGGEALLRLIDDEIAFTRLARMSPAEYDRDRKVTAKQLGIRLALLDAEVEARRRARPSPEAQRVAAEESVKRERLMRIQVDSAALLSRITELVRRYVVIPLTEAVVIALWVLHTYVIEAAQYTPYLHITSPERRCGKTRLLEVLAVLVFRPWRTDYTTPAALLRSVERDAPTLLLDEKDAAFKGSEEYRETMRGLLNSGFQRGGSYRVCEKGARDITLRDFVTFCAKALAGIGKLPDTVADRSFPILMRRRKRTEEVARFRRLKAKVEAAVLREDCEAWAIQHVERLREAQPDLPEALNDRQQDVAEPLLAIADAVGGEWPDRVRRALVELCTGKAAQDDSLGTQLLADIRRVFKARKTDRIPSEKLAAALGAMKDRPWAEWSTGKPITQNQLARQLSRFQIGPRTIRLSDDKTVKGKAVKGYHRDWFTDAWERYPASDNSEDDSCPAFPRDSKRHTVTARENTGKNHDLAHVTGLACGTSENAVSATENAARDGVTLSDAGYQGGEEGGPGLSLNDDEVSL